MHLTACTTKEVDEAFDAAKDAQKHWARVPLCKRADYIKKVAALLRENWQPIAYVLMSEVAKGKNDSKTEVRRALHHLALQHNQQVIRSAELMEYTAEEGARFFARNTMLLSDAFPNTDRTKICLESKVPLGVVLCIPPFNYPLNLAVSKIGPALMAGNTVVMKAPTQGTDDDDDVAWLDHMFNTFLSLRVDNGCVSGAVLCQGWRACWRVQPRHWSRV